MSKKIGARSGDGKITPAGKVLKIILAGSTVDRLFRFAAGLRKYPVIDVCQVQSAKQASNSIVNHHVDLVVIDEQLTDMTGEEYLRLLARDHPGISCALISSLPADQFHHQTEGLGVMMQLTSPPAMEEAEMVLSCFTEIRALYAEIDG